jgi:hypothetical protein
MVAPNSRLTAFCIGAFTAPSTCSSVDSAAASYGLAVSEAAGDSDLLASPAPPVPYVQNFNAVCAGGLGNQFCATARLQTSVVQRK